MWVFLCFGLPLGQTQIPITGLGSVQTGNGQPATLRGQLLLKEALSMLHDCLSNNRLLLIRNNYPEDENHCQGNRWRDTPQPASHPYVLHPIGAQGLDNEAEIPHFFIKIMCWKDQTLFFELLFLSKFHFYGSFIILFKIIYFPDSQKWKKTEVKSHYESRNLKSGGILKLSHDYGCRKMRGLV